MANWEVGEHSRYDPSAQMEVRFGGIRIGGITLLDEEEIPFNFQITPDAVASATGLDITVTATARTRGSAAPRKQFEHFECSTALTSTWL